MRYFQTLLTGLAILLFSGTGMLAAADYVVIDPPKQLEINASNLTPTHYVHVLPDFSISNVVREFLYTSSTGSYYRYHVAISNYGGACSECQIKLEAVSRYAYPNHQSTMVSQYNMVTAPSGDQSVVVTFVVNENKLFGYHYPDLFIVTFTIDADEEYLELDEENNTWHCDDVAGPCDTCVDEECP